MLQISYKSEYRKNGSTVFVYEVSSNNLDEKEAAKEIAAYEKVKGAYLRKDDKGKPLHFSNNLHTEVCELAPTQDKSNYYVKADLKEEYQLIQNKALETQGKLEGFRQFSGLSKKAMQELAMKAMFA